LVSNRANARPRFASGASLHDGVEGQAANEAATPTRPARSAALTWPPPKAAQQAADRDEDERNGQHPLLVLARRRIGPSAPRPSSRWR
jgi:hypothetical protein